MNLRQQVLSLCFYCTVYCLHILLPLKFTRYFNIFFLFKYLVKFQIDLLFVQEVLEAGTLNIYHKYMFFCTTVTNTNQVKLKHSL